MIPADPVDAGVPALTGREAGTVTELAVLDRLFMTMPAHQIHTIR
jgi:hypothetical protein